MQKYSKQQRKSGNESTLKKLNINMFGPIVLNYGLKPLLLLVFSGGVKSVPGKKK
jgi:hypothetical protein